jgi:hypothetical protein
MFQTLGDLRETRDLASNARKEKHMSVFLDISIIWTLLDLQPDIGFNN